MTNMPLSISPHAFFAEPRGLTSQECQQRAAECLRLVRIALDATNKALLLEMAQAWIRIAEQQKLISLSEGQRLQSAEGHC